MVKRHSNPMSMEVIRMKFQKFWVNFNKSTVEIRCQPNKLLRVSSIIGKTRSFDENTTFDRFVFSLLYEKRNQKKEAKEAAAYEAFQRLKAENRQESAAVNIEQNKS